MALLEHDYLISDGGFITVLFFNQNDMVGFSKYCQAFADVGTAA